MLFAFNGTGNKDEDDSRFDTNVVKICDSYIGYHYYQDGVGTGNWLEKLFGGLFGYGGKSIIKKAITELRKFDQGTIIDVVGFSRGSALAIDFCNEIESLGYKVRCLMLFDTVASFGIAGNDINIGYDLDCPANVNNIFHAMSLDERRDLFPLTRLKEAKEVWFRGFHSDIGGGNGNTGLNSIPLSWMFKMAEKSGVGFFKDLTERVKCTEFPDCMCQKPIDLIPGDLREVNDDDEVHESVTYRDFVAEGFIGNNPTQLPKV